MSVILFGLLFRLALVSLLRFVVFPPVFQRLDRHLVSLCSKGTSIE